MTNLKKLGISLGSLAAATMPVIAVVSCAKGNLTYKIVVDNAKDKNYTLSTQDANYQPINFQKGSYSFWDIAKTDKLDKLDQLLGAKSTQKLIFGIKDGEPFKNGLERIVYDLLKANDNNIDLTLTYTIDKNNLPSIVITKDILKSQGNTIKTAEFREDQLKNTKIVFDDFQADAVDKTAIKNLVSANDFAVSGKYHSLSSKYSNKGDFDNIVDHSTLGQLKDIYKYLKAADSSTAATDLKTPNAIIVNALADVFKNIKLIKYDSTNNNFTAVAATPNEWVKAIDDMLAEIKK